MKKKIFAICLMLVMGLNFMSACSKETDENERRKNRDDSSVSETAASDSDENEDEKSELKGKSDSSDEESELSDEEKDDKKKDDEDDDKESSSEPDEDIALEDDFEMSEYYERCQKGELFGYSTRYEQGIYDVVNDEYYPYDNSVDITESYNGYLPFCVNNKYGYIDIDGVVVIEPQFDYAKGFTSRGMALVEQNGCYGFINDKGEYIIEPVYDYYGTYEDEIYLKGYNDEHLYPLNNGELVSEEEFRLLTADENELFFTVADRKGTFADKYGNVIYEIDMSIYYDSQCVGDGYYLIITEETDENDGTYHKTTIIIKDKSVIYVTKNIVPCDLDDYGMVSSGNKVLVYDRQKDYMEGEFDLVTKEITYYPDIVDSFDESEIPNGCHFRYWYTSLFSEGGFATVRYSKFVYDENYDDYYEIYVDGIVDRKQGCLVEKDFVSVSEFNESGYADAGFGIINENFEVVSTMDAEYWRLDD